jgi:acid stress-induced BolA-like protein IbaG/YrbA
MDNEDLKQFIQDGLPAEHVLNRGTGQATRIVSDFVGNDLIKDSLDEIRASMLIDDLSPCQRMVLLLLTYT